MVPEAALTVQRIFGLATDGYGVDAITRRLNKEGVPPIGRVGKWHMSFINSILKNRSVLGEFQPHTGPAGSRVPVGEPVPDYYPAIVDEDTFYAAQHAVASRRGKVGRRGREVFNLFTRLVFDAVGGSSMVLDNRMCGQREEGRLVSSATLRGEKGPHGSSVRYEPFEQQMLTWVAGLEETVSDSDPDAALAAKELQATEGMHAEVVSRAGKVEARLVDGPGDRLDAMLDLLEKLKGKAKELEARREELKARLQAGRLDAFGVFRTAWQQLRETPADQRERARSRLKTAIAAIVSRFDVTAERVGGVTHVLVKIHAVRAAGTSHVYFVVRGAKSAWLSVDTGGKVDLAKLRKARYVPFSWKEIPRANETDLPVPAPIVKGTSLAEFAPGADDDWVEDAEDTEDD